MCVNGKLNGRMHIHTSMRVTCRQQAPRNKSCAALAQSTVYNITFNVGNEGFRMPDMLHA